MPRAAKLKLVILAAAALVLSACTTSEIRIDPDFGKAFAQDEAAQIADPDAHYANVPAPGSNGARVALAQHRYQTNTVVQPSAVSASSSASTTGFDNGASAANGAASGVGMATSTGP